MKEYISTAKNSYIEHRAGHSPAFAHLYLRLSFIVL